MEMGNKAYHKHMTKKIGSPNVTAGEKAKDAWVGRGSAAKNASSKIKQPTAKGYPSDGAGGGR